MKKLSFVLSILLSVTMFSCNENEEVIEDSNPKPIINLNHESNDAWQELFASTEQLNWEFHENYGYKTTRGPILPWLKRVWDKIKDTVVADAASAVKGYTGTGTAEGAVVCGVLGSIVHIISKESVDSVSLRRIPACNNYTLTYNSLSNTVISDSCGLVPLDSAGYMHNKVVIEMFNDNPNSFYAGLNDCDTLLSNVCDYYSYETNYSSSSLYGTLHNATIINNIYNTVRSNPTNVYPAFLNMAGVDTECLHFVNDYIENISEMSDLQVLNTYTEHILNKILRSNVASSEKEAMKAGVLVARSSMALWIEYYNMVGEL